MIDSNEREYLQNTALVRPGRFYLNILLELPDLKWKIKIYNDYIAKW